MNFRIVTEEDKEAVKWLWAYCFENHEPFYSWYFSQYYQNENTLGGYQENQLISCLQLVPYQLFLRGQFLATSYIIGLATYPQARRGGVVKELLKEALEEMRRREHYISILMPFNAGFYYPYQWETCYHHYKYIIPLNDLQGISKPWGDFVLVKGKEGITKLQKIYKKFTADKHGYVVRTEMNWRYLLEEHWGEGGFVYLLEKDGKAKGYIMYFLRQNKALIKEMAYTSLEAQKAIFQFLYNHRSQVKTLEWNAPLDDLTYFLLPDPKNGIRLFPFMTGRVVDVAKALETISYPRGINEKVSFKIEDNLAFWNNQTFSLEVRDGKGYVEAQGKKDGEISCSIGAFSQLLFGRLSGEELGEMGKLEVTYPKKLEILDKIFPKCNNYINEYF